MFKSPTPELIDRMRERGVTWLVAQNVDAYLLFDALGQLATKRYDNGVIAIYELDPYCANQAPGRR